MKLYYETVPVHMLECLRKLMANVAFNDFVLVGGTALSLQLGHRMSVDIDLFTSISYGSMNLEEIKRALTSVFPYTERMETLSDRSPGYMLYIGNSREEKVKLDLFYTDDFIEPIVERDGLRMASVQDIAAMKMLAVVTGKRKKDFWDIHELLEHFTLEELIRFGIRRNPYTLTEDDILYALYNSEQISQDTVIRCFKGKFWELITEDLQTAVERRKNHG